LKRRGFTLIELLIVVAIIAILAAIAVPNFLEAQIRAKVSRVKSDMRTIVVAIEALHVDYGVMLVDFWDDDTTIGIDRLHNTFGRTEQTNNQRAGPMGVLVPLTTPIAYLSSIPLDPFNQPDFSQIVNSQIARAPWTYCYIDDDPQIDGHDSEASFAALANGEYVLLSPGPDLEVVAPNKYYAEINDLLYDPTNGIVSYGMVIYSSRTNFDARTSH